MSLKNIIETPRCVLKFSFFSINSFFNELILKRMLKTNKQNIVTNSKSNNTSVNTTFQLPRANDVRWNDPIIRNKQQPMKSKLNKTKYH
jgi:hypothetical protein